MNKFELQNISILRARPGLPTSQPLLSQELLKHGTVALFFAHVLYAEGARVAGAYDGGCIKWPTKRCTKAMLELKVLRKVVDFPRHLQLKS